MHIEMRPLRECLAIAHPENPKEHEVGWIADSIVRFGFIAPPTIDEETGVMVAGHGRCEALDHLRRAGRPDRKTTWPPRNIEAQGDDWMVPVIRGVSFASEAERDAYIVADNQLVIAGGWSKQSLTKFLANMKDTGRSGVGFSDKQYERILGQYRGVKERTVVETTARPATFHLQIRGPVSSQPDVIEKLRAALEAMPGIEVVGHVDMDE